MNIIHSPGSVLLPGPEGTVSLPVVRDPSGYYSYWKPNEKELALLNSGCSIQLGIHHNVHPVVSMEVAFALGENVKGRYTDETITRVAVAILQALEEDGKDIKRAVSKGLDAL
ncbi:hypothetical protein F406_gp025 [Agrobacterium phage 7-7-1]|uniref:Uncharacterized protein n=1 Tax=Agrobacterium phage 7-7-1 TaxID=1161931 RepID=J7F8Z1_9CAUD|nr:hypothetical protein F406_gp025 [Agrobacterium phage 7-7-1]AFH19790.1 hypothetical protein 7-7-1_00092 [Agrobacterium phage 7-7-1]